MAKTMEDIHLDTSNIRNNVKAMLFHSIQSTKDPVLKKEMGELLQDADKMELSQFLTKIENSRNPICEFLKKAAVPALLIGGALAAGPFAPAIFGVLTAHGVSAGVAKAGITIAGHAINTAIQCSGRRGGFWGSLLTGGGYGDRGYGETRWFEQENPFDYITK